MFRLLTLAASLAVLPACFLSVKVHDDDEASGRGGPGEVVDTTPPAPAVDTAPEPLVVEVVADPAELDAGTSALLILEVSGDLVGADLVALSFDEPVETWDWRVLGDGSVVVDVYAPATASGPIGLTVAGDAGTAYVEGVLTVVPSDAPAEPEHGETDCAP